MKNLILTLVCSNQSSITLPILNAGLMPNLLCKKWFTDEVQRKPHQFGCLLPWSDHFKSSSVFLRSKKKKRTIFLFWCIAFCVEQSFLKWKKQKGFPTNLGFINGKMLVTRDPVQKPVGTILMHCCKSLSNIWSDA